MTIARQEWHKREQQMDRELSQLRENKEEMTSTNTTLQKRYEKEMAAKTESQQMED